MSAPRYLWRQLNEKQRAKLLVWRKARGYPWHSPAHRANFGHLRFLFSASCVEHCHYIGHSPERMDNFSSDLVAVFAAHAEQMFAWCVLPNHYHALVETPEVKALPRELGLVHGRTAHAWNGEEQARGPRRPPGKSHIIALDRSYFCLGNVANATAAAEVRFLTSSLHRMCSTCLQMVPVHAPRMTPIS